MRTSWWAAVTAVGLALALAGCAGAPGGGDAGRVCAPGSTQACLCAGGASGAQACNALGDGYERCECGADAGPAARCGDGTCGGAETCSTCAADCGTCGDECRVCRTNADCPGGSCGIRACDGRRTCVPASGMADCRTVGGAECPATSVYRRCTAAAECGILAECVRVVPGATETVCASRCEANPDCPSPPPGRGVAYCFRNRCFLSCPQGMCPDGLTCMTDPSEPALTYCR